MARPSDLAALRLALLQQPGDPRRWQVLIERIEAMGAGLLLSELDGLFEQPLPASPAGRDSLPRQVLQQGLEAHRAGDIEGLRRAQKRLLELEPEGAWPCALQGLLAELEGVSGYAAFARALALEPGDPWFRYWLSVAALRRRDWLDFSCHALLLTHSETLEHQVLVLAAAAHLIAAVLVTLAPDLCEANDLRVFDLVHPDAIPHDQPQLVAAVLRCMDKERRKMMRILIDFIRRSANEASGTEMLPPVPMHALVDLLRWRIAGLPQPRFSADLHAALQRQLELLPLQRQQHGDLETLLPRRPDLIFGDEHLRVWRDFRLVLMSAQ
jgi:hypothetical protein